MSNTTTAEKVRIPAEVADAIESLRSESDMYDRSNRKFINWCVKPEYQAGPRRKILQDYARENFDTLIKALYNGYEIEKPPKKIALELTPEELGAIVAKMAVAEPVRADVYAENHALTVLGGRCGSSEVHHLFIRLKQRYYEEARA
ncbi:DUF1642 domain-containing protein [Aneurinibacillus aneurinilyticus]|uniref:DUF1642 domain-containing protein n=1 Tax=Aneurinibacillus aneurinilyticus TaxID=1391 RepID=A0A848CZV0_ANEAE|nr:DUF1642 domain-containing protein [Aneurinibacillus aneurinilyticus]NMF00030.1 DUF1642 domain-containing protein [Aneurinibacillus aneurinilyticus]